jgi:hypothetical protein
MTTADTTIRAPERAHPALHPMISNDTGLQSANAFQRLLLQSYPSAALLGFALDDYAEINRQVSLGLADDKLFAFMWETLAGLDPNDRRSAALLLDSAISNMEAVKKAILGITGPDEHAASQLPTIG